MRAGAQLWSLVALGAVMSAPSLDLTTRDLAFRASDGLERGNAALQSAGQLAFGPGGVLFVADARAGAIYAIDVAESGGTKATGNWNIADIDLRIAAAVGSTTDDLRINDMVTHPVSGNAYLSITRGRGAAAAPVLVRVTTTGQVTPLDLSNVRFSTTAIPSAPTPSDTNRWGQPKWMMSVTDLAFADGMVWIAGLSNEQFASSLRRVPYPFSNSSAQVATLEVYHTSHDKFETESPVTSFLPITVNGRASMIAGYGCAPVAIFDRATLDAQKHVKGRTVAELGGGNAPLDIVSYAKDGREYLLISNSDRTLMRFDRDSLLNSPTMTTSVKTAYQPAGASYLPLAVVGVMQLAPYSDKSLAILQRNITTGRVVYRNLQLWF